MGRGPGPGNEGRTSRKGRRRGTTTAAVQPASACPHNTVVLTTQAQKKTNSMTTTRLTTLHSRVALHSRDYRVQTAHYTPLARAIYRVVAACTGLDKKKRRAAGARWEGALLLHACSSVLACLFSTARHGSAQRRTWIGTTSACERARGRSPSCAVIHMAGIVSATRPPHAGATRRRRTRRHKQQWPPPGGERGRAP